MKNVFIFLLLGFLLFFAFSGIGTAEEAGGGGDKLIFRECSLDVLYLLSGDTNPRLPIQLGNIGEGYFYYQWGEDTERLYYTVKNELEHTIKRNDVGFELLFHFRENGKLFITCREKDLAKIEQALAKRLPKRSSYDVRMILLSIDKSKETPTGTTTYSNFKQAFSAYTSIGYTPQFDLTTSLTPDRSLRMEDRVDTTYISDYESLIAIFFIAFGSRGPKYFWWKRNSFRASRNSNWINT